MTPSAKLPQLFDFAQPIFATGFTFKTSVHTMASDCTKSFLTVCLNPTLQKTFTLPQLRLGEVNRASSHRLDASGKGVNVSRVLAQLGAPVIHLCQTGGKNQQLFLDMAVSDGFVVEHVDSGCDIRSCYTLLDSAVHSATEVVEEGNTVAPSTESALREKFSQLLAGCHTVIISGSKAPGFSAQLFPNFVAQAKAAGKLVVLDYRGLDLVDSLKYTIFLLSFLNLFFGIRYHPDVIKPNFAEFAETLCGTKVSSETSQDAALQEKVKLEMLRLYAAHGIVTVLTHGHLPTLYVDGSDTVKEVSPTMLSTFNFLYFLDIRQAM